MNKRRMLLEVRQAWVLGPFVAGLQCLYLDTPFPEKQNTKKLNYGTTMNHVHSQWGQILDKSCKKIKKTQLQLLKSLEQKKGVVSKSRVLGCPLHTPPPKPPLWPTSGHAPTLTPYKERVPPQALGSQRTRGPVDSSHPPPNPCCNRSPSKALPEFLVGPLVSFY